MQIKLPAKVEYQTAIQGEPMKISELIGLLEAKKKEYGDKEIRIVTPDGIRPIVDVSPGISFDREDFLILEHLHNWPSKTGEPSGKKRDNA